MGLFKTLRKLLKGDRVVFDLIVGAGDSGIAMVKLTEMVYQKLGQKMPTKLLVPFYRYTQKDIPNGQIADNSALIATIKRELSAVDEINTILFVDDEIGDGTTLKGIIDLINQAKKNSIGEQDVIYVVAEDKDNQFEQKIETKIKFLPFAYKNEGTFSAISYVIPDNFEGPIKEKYSDKEHSSKERMNVLLNLPIKTMINGVPRWSKNWQVQLEKEIPGFEGLQQGFKQYLDNLLEEAVEHA